MIYEKIFNIQQNLCAPKSQFNNFGKYSYRSCEDILEALKPLLNENKLIVTLSDEIKEIGGRIYVQATAQAIDAETGEIVETKASAREEESKKGMDSSQVTGASSSYARKYALNGLFAIDDNKDSDTTNKGSSAERTETAENGMVFAPDGNLYCAECGSVISGVRYKNGKEYTAKDIAKKSMEKYGEQLCHTCVKNREKQTA